MTWLCDANGDPLVVPAACVGFRIRHWPPKARGPGAVVRDDQGGPLVVPTHVTASQFRERVGDRAGRYVLTALDARRRPLRRAAEAVVVLHGGELASEVGPHALAQILAHVDAGTSATATAIAQLAAAVEQLGAAVGVIATMIPDAGTGAGARPPARPPMAPREVIRARPTPAEPSAPPVPVSLRTHAQARDHLRDLLDDSRSLVETASRTHQQLSAHLDARRATPAPSPSPAPALPARVTPQPPSPPMDPRDALSDDEVRAQMAELVRRLPPLPRILIGASVSVTPDLTTFREGLAAVAGDVDQLALLFMNPTAAEALIPPLAERLGLPVADLLALWTAPELPPEIERALLEPAPRPSITARKNDPSNVRGR